jgi:hypothetical protein
VVDLLSDPALLRRARETFAQEIGGVTYRPLISAEQKPTVVCSTAR